MRTFIFGIGGTGARVLRSLTMLLAAGCKGTKADETIVPIIIDYDTENGSLDQTQKLMECYQRIHNRAYDAADNVTEKFFCSPLKKLKEIGNTPARFNSGTKFEVYLDSKEVNGTFAEHIGYNTINGTTNTLPTRYLLDALYDTSDGVNAELNLSLEKGFKGCPNIGSVVTKRLKNTEEIQQFLQICDKNDRILIIGSIFGGTGASGIPMLLDLITDPALGHPDTLVGVIAVEPYFKVLPSKKSVINSSTFVAKTKAALEAYNIGTSVNKQADSIYYVGDDQTGEALTNVEGGAEQKNPAHFVELVAAICAIDFMAGNRAPHTDDQTEAMFFETWMDLPEANNAGEGVQAIEVSAFYKDELEIPYISAISRLAIFNEFCKNYYLDAGEGERSDVFLRNTGLSKEKDFRNDLREFIDAFEAWINEMQEREEHKLNIFNLKDKDYTTLLKGKVMSRTKKIKFLSEKVISDSDFRSRLGKKVNDLDTNAHEQNILRSRPCFNYLTWMSDITADYYKTIEEWTK